MKVGKFFENRAKKSHWPQQILLYLHTVDYRRMRKLFLLILLFIGRSLSAQEIEILSFAPTMDITAKLNPVYDDNGQATALLKISVASDKVSFDGNFIGVPVYEHGDWLLHVPSGTKDIRINVAGYTGTNFEFPINIESYHTYEMIVNLPIKERGKALIMPSLSISSIHTSYGIMAGYVKKKFGGYVRAKSDFQFGIPIVGTCDAQGKSGGSQLWLTGENTRKSRYAFTAGAIFRIISPLYFYAGAGYGSRILAWQNYNGTDYYKVTSSSFTGVEAEVGLLAHFGIFAISAGVQTNQFKYVEANVGIGVLF